MRTGWVPDQHGAWAMTLSPLIIGIFWTAPTGRHALLAAAWLCAFLTFNSFEMWAKTSKKRRARTLPALLCYAAATAVLGLALVWLSPGLLWWTPIFAAPVLLTCLLVYRGRERDLATRGLSIATAVLILPVGAGLERASGAPSAQPHEAWTATAVLFLYFFGTVLFVRSMIRKRADAGAHRACIAWHAVTGALVVGIGAIDGYPRPVLAAVAWALLIARAVILPRMQSARGTLRPAILGLTEVAWCVILTAALMVH